MTNTERCSICRREAPCYSATCGEYCGIRGLPRYTAEPCSYPQPVAPEAPRVPRVPAPDCAEQLGLFGEAA